MVSGMMLSRKLDRALGCCAAPVYGGDGAQVGRRRVEADAAARLHHVDDDQADARAPAPW